jgi:hypothetical protein
MSKRKARTIEGVEIQESGGNVYADLGYPDAEEMLVKERGSFGKSRRSYATKD